MPMVCFSFSLPSYISFYRCDSRSSLQTLYDAVGQKAEASGKGCGSNRQQQRHKGKVKTPGLP